MPVAGGEGYHPSEVLEASYANWRDHNAPIQSFEALLEIGPFVQSDAVYPAGVPGPLTGDELVQVVERRPNWELEGSCQRKRFWLSP